MDIKHINIKTINIDSLTTGEYVIDKPNRTGYMWVKPSVKPTNATELEAWLNKIPTSQFAGNTTVLRTFSGLSLHFGDYDKAAIAASNLAPVFNTTGSLIYTG
jgi:hypothetical protein